MEGERERGREDVMGDGVSFGMSKGAVYWCGDLHDRLIASACDVWDVPHVAACDGHMSQHVTGTCRSM